MGSSSNDSPGRVLFSLPIADPGGNVTVTQPAPKVYLLTFTSGADNRLTSSFCQTIIRAMDILQHTPSTYPPGVLITTSGIPKFYSNGLDIEHSRLTPGFWPDSLYALWLRFITYPMPTVALINGHAFAGGFMCAMMQDYRCMNPHKGFLCTNELELGAPLRPPMVSVFREKISGATLRKLFLEAHRFKALEALQEGLVDCLGGLPEVLAYIDEFKLVQKAQKGLSGNSVYGVLKQEMYRETIGLLEGTSEESIRMSSQLLQWQKERKDQENAVRAWEKTKAKL